MKRNVKDTILALQFGREVNVSLKWEFTLEDRNLVRV